MILVPTITGWPIEKPVNSFFSAQTFEKEVNSWKDINWFETQFVLLSIQDHLHMFEVSRNYLDTTVLTQLLVHRTQGPTQPNPDKSILPTLNEYVNYEVLQTAQMTKNPSDIVLIMSKRTFVLEGNYEHKARRHGIYTVSLL